MCRYECIDNLFFLKYSMYVVLCYKTFSYMYSIWSMLLHTPPPFLTLSSLISPHCLLDNFTSLFYNNDCCNLCVWPAHACSAHRSQKRALDRCRWSYGQLWVTYRGCWEPNLGPLEQQATSSPNHSRPSLLHLCPIYKHDFMNLCKIQ
jgi:hypothetical protein